MTDPKLLSKVYVLLSDMSELAMPTKKKEIDDCLRALSAEYVRLVDEQSPPPLGVAVSDGIDTKEKLR